ncbi:MAG TPA: tetratricopeptide repeat protein [Thermoanaerobaculia bacterium]|nr:tetratricopeptide repeat protein [Thermoanaerobaculia bacterium]
MKRPIPVLLALLLLTPFLGGCHKVRARVEMKKGNERYLNENYRDALVQYQKGLDLDPSATFAWRSVGLSALALYKPGDNSRANREMGDLAVKAFESYLEDYPDDEKVRDYLISTYVNSKKYDQALAYLEKQAQADPSNANIQASRIRLLIEAGRMDEARQLANTLPPNQAKAEALYSLAVTAWDNAFHGKNTTMPAAEQEKRIDEALTGMQEALRINPEYFEAMVYYNLLFREKAKLQTDEAKKQEYTAVAIQWQDKAKALRKKMQEEEKKKQAESAKTTES